MLGNGIRSSIFECNIPVDDDNVDDIRFLGVDGSGSNAVHEIYGVEFITADRNGCNGFDVDEITMEES